MAAILFSSPVQQLSCIALSIRKKYFFWSHIDGSKVSRLILKNTNCLYIKQMATLLKHLFSLQTRKKEEVQFMRNYSESQIYENIARVFYNLHI